MVLRPKRDGRDRDAVQARVPERLLAGGRCQIPHAPPRAGSTDGLPSQVWVAVSRDRIYAFEARPDSVGELLGTWERQTTTVRTALTLTTTRLTLGFDTHGPRLELAARRFRLADHRLLRYLRDPGRVT